jgi:hypothetical protein
MKPVSIIVGALAAFASAAPAKEARSAFDLSQVNNLEFNNLNFAYLGVVNQLNLQLLEQLGQVNNLNVLNFQSLFSSNSFDLNAALQFQQLQTVLQFAQLGLFNQFDLSGLNLNALNLGLINNVGGFDLNSQVDAGLVPQLNQVISSAGVVVAKE